MKRIRRQDTAPELAVRRCLHRNGLRFLLHRRDLPGTPDIVLPRFRTAIFVHGCFWHGHECKHGTVASKSNAAFWAEKIRKNRDRDGRKCAELVSKGWIVETIWECETHNAQLLAELIERIRRRVS